ncbi:MAG: DUF4417 domain-containing protein [Gammaproteobacteria bacterium]|nr:DUF4417 domain-containing protein [Gammaproteobacteria bacterium]
MRAPSVSAVALSLFEVVEKKNGVVRFSTREELLEYFKLNEDTTVVLSGTDIDNSLERWWGLEDREAVIRGIKQLGVCFITAPNYSLFDDVPRHDNLYNMKRIALAFSEIQRHGVPCGLHLNARTDRDWERWLEFLYAHPEISHVAFEFGTGAGNKTRIGWYVHKLVTLAASLDRPLHLVARGGLSEISKLANVFDGLTIIETNAFMRAQKRRRGVMTDGKLSWTKSPTAPGKPLDDLLDANIAALRSYVNQSLPLIKPKQTVN